MKKQDKKVKKGAIDKDVKELTQKLTESEHSELVKIMNKGQQLRAELAQHTLEKEEQIRHTNEKYDFVYSKYQDEIDFMRKTQKKLVAELHEKYGEDVQFNLDNGEITKRKKE